ncbi:unnamed protein product [Microthlaspi erraticum]|uniref:Wall-associated receptor kinase galacturonan-binding domain-containing protein n=1 Tax=Microthlaspi erraticum TaxID=1685480 RepID=A0A6D2HUX1_9BRAS|nr:unnamed protein product [Microthlaspi erraticum]
MELLREKYVWVCFLLLSFAATSSVTTRQTRTHCKTTCGNLTLEFPFGTSPRCVPDERFLVICKEREGKAFLNTTKQEVLSISSDGELQVLVDILRVCKNNTGGVDEGRETDRIEDAGFTFSDKNQVTLVGCNVDASWDYFTGVGDSSDSCVTHCSSSQPIHDDSCSGNGCCKYPVTSGGAYGLWVETTGFFNPCIYAFIVKAGYFFFSGEQDLENLRNVTRFPVILDWTMEGTCQTSSCGLNTYCTNHTSRRGPSYSCKCLKGFEGNPYFPYGCNGIPSFT